MRTAILALVVCSAASADIVRLKNGGRVEGIARTVGDKVIVETFAGETTIALSDVDSIDDKHVSKLEEYYARARELDAAKDPAELVKLAGWARREGGGRFVKGLVDRAVELSRASAEVAKVVELGTLARDAGLGPDARPIWERALSLDGSCEPARRELGFKLHDGKWLTEDEWQVAQGNVKFEGKWIAATERDLILKDRLAKLEERIRAVEKRESAVTDREKVLDAELARLDKARKALEAEAREIERREALVRAREKELAAFTWCGGCLVWYKGAHLCTKGWHFCAPCDLWYKSGHSCRK